MPKSINRQNLRIVLVSCFTGCNMLLGLISMLSAAAGAINVAALCLLGCIVCDSIDGALARLLKASSPFGAQFDSLADMSSFSLASAVLVYYWFQPVTPHWIVLGAACLYVLAGAIRLARFNVTPYDGDFFQGMPTTGVAAVLVLVYLTFPSLEAGLGLGLFVLLALLMVSVFPYMKLTQLKRFPRWAWPLLSAGAILNLAFVSLPLMLWAAVGAYVCSGPVLWLRNRHRAAQ